MKKEKGSLTTFKVSHIRGMLNKDQPEYIPQNHDVTNLKQNNSANSRNGIFFKKKNEPSRCKL